MNRCNLFLASIALAFVAGCASMNTPTSTDQQGGTVVTGSRIPVREGTTSDVKTTTNKDAITEMMRGGAYVPSKAGGL